MGPAWLRRSSRLIASLLLLSSLWQLPHRWQDDQACAPRSEAHDESQHVFTASQAADHAEHCAVCHWTRILKPGETSAASAATTRGATRDLGPFAADWIRDPGSDRLPPRAPPAAC